METIRLTSAAAARGTRVFLCVTHCSPTPRAASTHPHQPTLTNPPTRLSAGRELCAHSDCTGGSSPEPSAPSSAPARCHQPCSVPQSCHQPSVSPSSVPPALSVPQPCPDPTGWPGWSHHTTRPTAHPSLSSICPRTVFFCQVVNAHRIGLWKSDF